MSTKNTISAFLSKDNMSECLAQKIITNLKDKEMAKMVFNLSQLNFNFFKKEVVLTYYVMDKSYPDVILSFVELIQLLKRAKFYKN